MNRATNLFASDLVRIVRHDHPAGRGHRDPSEEVAPDACISFVDSGRFTVHRGRRSWRLDAGDLFVTRPGFAYRCSHDARYPGDVCLSVVLSPALAEESPGPLGRPLERSAPALPGTNRSVYLRRRLERLLAQSPDALAIETLAAELMAGLEGAPEARRRLYGAGQIAWYAERIDAARSVLERRHAEPHALGSLAREAGMSPFHFARIFSELTGTPPHRYLVRARLARAAAMLRDGAGVTQACFAAGFNSLSHFIHTFKRAYGLPPSRYRVAPTATPPAPPARVEGRLLPLARR